MRVCRPARALLAFLAAALPGCAGRAAPAGVDTHVHFWDVAAPGGIGWPRPGHPLYRTFLPGDYAPIARRSGVGAVVVVQSGSRVEDNAWTLELAARHGELCAAVVGNLSLVIGTDAFEKVFEDCCRHARFAGYRLSQRPLGEAFFGDPVWKHLELTAARGKTLDVLMGSFDLDDVERIARRLPGLKIMVNHGGGGPIDGGPPDPRWLKSLEAAARHPNVSCKVSGFFDRSTVRPAPRTVAHYAPRLDALWRHFGEDRLVFGSDWPVTELDGTHGDYTGMLRDYFRGKGGEAWDKVFHRNACRFYKIAPPPGAP